MSKYTTQVRFICESYAGFPEQGGYSDVDEAIAKSLDKVFDFDFPIFDEEYRSIIETKFLLHYYTREIGFETVSLWKLKLRDRILLKIPYYNQLWASALMKLDPFKDTDYTVEHAGSGTEDRKGSVESDSMTKRTGSDLEKFSDTPQGGLDGVINTDYLTNATETVYGNNTGVESTGKSTDNMTNTNQYIDHITGKKSFSSYSKLLTEYRQTFMNIDEMFINEFKDLFMLVY